jgi:small subunit ribosomal protein S10e
MSVLQRKETASPTTLVPKANRDNIYRFLFTEGVLTCEKNPLGKWRGKLGGRTFEVPALHVMTLMRSLISRNLVTEQFAWRHCYWFLKDEGVAFLRKYLHLPEAAVPNTQRRAGADEEYEVRPTRAEGERRPGMGRGRAPRGDGEVGGRGGRGRGNGERQAYRDSANDGAASYGRGRGRGGGRGRGAASAVPVDADAGATTVGSSSAL